MALHPHQRRMMAAAGTMRQWAIQSHNAAVEVDKLASIAIQRAKDQGKKITQIGDTIIIEDRNEDDG